METVNNNPSVTAATANVSSQWLTFLRRLGSFIILWAIVLAVIFKASPFVFYLTFSVIVAIALWECYTIFEKAGLPSFKYLGVLGGCFLLSWGWYGSRHTAIPWAEHAEAAIGAVLILFILGRQLAQAGNPKPLETIAGTIFGLLYVPWLLNFILKIAYLQSPDVFTGDNKFFVIYLIVITKFSDVGAYVVGSLFGRHKLIPRISPNKTWEGAVGAILVPLALSLLLFWSQRTALEKLNFTWQDAAILGVLIGFVAMIGDLVESLIKRIAKVKDSGTFIPGIGGALDLVDSLLFTAPVVYLYLRLVVGIPAL